MKEKRIDFETALLAKEKGFNVQTFSHCWVKTLDDEILHNDDLEDKPEHDRSTVYLMQPTQELLKKWLRETHNIHIEILRSFNYFNIFIKKYDSEEDHNEEIDLKGKEFKDFEIYEEAFEEALKEALKIINL